VTTVIDGSFFRDDPERVRQRLSTHPERASVRGDWYVFETISADGSLAVGMAEGEPNPAAVIVVYEHLSHRAATLAAQSLAEWHRGNGRKIDGDRS
jgi:phage-related baseplate assembly protein